MFAENNKLIVRRFFEEGPSKGNLKAANELLASNFALHVPLPCAPGVQGISDVITACRAAFEDLNVTIEDMMVEGDKVVADSQLEAVIKAPSWAYSQRANRSQ